MDWKHLSKSGLPCRLFSLLNHAPEFLILNVNFKRWLKVPNLVPNILKMPKILQINWQQPVSLLMIKTCSLFFLMACYPLIHHLSSLLNLHPVKLISHLKIFKLNCWAMKTFCMSITLFIAWIVLILHLLQTNLRYLLMWKKIGPPLPPTKMQNTSSSNYHP